MRNNPIEIAHEAPLSIFDKMQSLTDYDYCLVHLLEENKRYLKKFEQAKLKGRKIILDNSIFELGEAFDMDRYAYWVERLQPNRYIIPDSLENSDKTKEQAGLWVKLYGHLQGDKIGVVQGKSVSQIIDCYQYLDNEINCDSIAISFDYSLYQQIYPHSNILVSWCFGRIWLVNHLLENKIINLDKKHHLLGASLPIGFSFYNDQQYSFITSLDTSSPVMCGVSEMKYDDFGVRKKPATKLFKIIDKKLNSSEKRYVFYNVNKFRSITCAI